MRTGRDVVVAAILGADEFGFSTAPLIALGCVMMRVCHLNTCPVGVATQDPVLRERFEGEPEHVVNYLFMVAEEARRIMARLGVRSMEELIGRTDLLDTDQAVDHRKAQDVDLRALLSVPENVEPDAPRRCVRRPDPVLYDSIDVDLLQLCRPAVEQGQPVRLERRIENKNRAVGGLLSGEIARVHGENGLPDGSIHVSLTGSAGQSFGAWLARGVELVLDGRRERLLRQGPLGRHDRGAPARRRHVRRRAQRDRREHGPLRGHVRAAPSSAGSPASASRCATSGAITVVEGLGDHGCEYMTGGRVVVLGPTGLNFAAGMSGGIAYVLRRRRRLPRPLQHRAGRLRRHHPDESEELRGWVGAPRAHRLHRRGAAPRRLAGTLNKIVKVMPHDYKRALAEQLAAEGEAEVAAAAAGPPPRPATPPEARSSRWASWAHSSASSGSASRSATRRARARLPAVLPAAGRPHAARPGRALHGLRHPLCHEGCPLGNLIPDWNDLVYRDHWRDALTKLHATNNFPEFTGLICPAPCESACVLDINDDAVTIEQIELAIVTRGFEEGWIAPEPPESRTDRTVAVIGSGRPGSPSRPS